MREERENPHVLVEFNRRLDHFVVGARRYAQQPVGKGARYDFQLRRLFGEDDADA
jgi:hypothetical protein